ncbi:MAG: serine hydrolase, partial [Pyrinomonadaceae bacterium]
MDPVKLAEAMATLPSPSVVIRNGRIVGQKGDIARAGFVWSGSKSLTALIFGRLLQQGRIANYDVMVPGSNDPTDPPASFRQFLSMTSDYNLNPHSPGNHYAYNNGAVHFYGAHLKNTFYPGRTEVQMLQDAFASVLGFQDPLNYNTSGFLSGWGGGWSMSTRDMARIAYLVLRNGNWNGQQVIPASFVDDLHHLQIPSSATWHTNTSDQFFNESVLGEMPRAYSVGFWLPHLRPQSDPLRSTTEAISMNGAFGTTVLVSRAKDLVIVSVNSSSTHQGGRISGAALDLVAAAINSNTPPPSPTPTPAPTPTPVPTPTPIEQLIIGGWVTRMGTDTHMANVRVTLSKAGVVVGNQLTNSQGVYAFAVPAGTYSVVASLSGFNFTPAAWNNVSSSLLDLTFAASTAPAP